MGHIHPTQQPNYQEEYEKLTVADMAPYLSAIEKAREGVITILGLSLHGDDLESELHVLPERIDGVVTEIFHTIAEDDVLGFSLNPLTKFRHQIRGLGATISTCSFYFRKLQASSRDDQGHLKVISITRTEATERAQSLIKKKIAEFGTVSKIEVVV